MQSSAKTVREYLASLPEDRRRMIEAVRNLILANLDTGFEEGMQYGMIGYYVPHRLYPAGYHCDPKQPLPFTALASQKNYLSLYMMGLYGADHETTRWFTTAWDEAGKRLDMGKCCLRFKKLDDLALDVLAEYFRGVTAAAHIEQYEASLAMARKSPPANSRKPAPSPAAGKAKTKSATHKKVVKKPNVKKKPTGRQKS